MGLFGGLSLLRHEGGSSPEGSRPALLEPSAHEGATSLAFRSETELLSVDPGGTLKHWDLASRKTHATSLVGRGFYRRDTFRVLLDPTGSVCVSLLGGRETCYALDLSSSRSAVRLGSSSWAKPAAGGRYLYGAEEVGRRLFLFRRGAAQPERTFLAAHGWTFSEHTALSPDGRYAAALVGPPDRCEVVVGDSHDGGWCGVGPASGPAGLQFSPDGGSLGWMEGAGEGRKLHLRRVGTWRVEPPVTLPGGPALFRFSPDGRRVALLSEAEREYLLFVPLPEHRRERVFVLRVVSLGSRAIGAAAGPVRGHAAQITDCAWSPRGRTVATLDEDGRIALWNARSGRLERFLDPHG